MIKQYIKQSIQMLKENRLVSVISIAGTADFGIGSGAAFRNNHLFHCYDYGGSPGVPDTVRQFLSGEQPRPDDVCG